MERETKPIICYITGDAMISSLGFSTAANIAAIKEYKSGISLDSSGQFSTRPMNLALIDRSFYDELGSEKYLGLTPLEFLMVKVVEDLLLLNDLDIKSSDTALVLATTKGNVGLLSDDKSICKEVWLSATAQKLKTYFESPNPVELISNACISGVSALIYGKRLIENNEYKKVVVIGCDVLSHFISSGFLSFRSISATPCRPYDQDRNGLSLGEACGAILLSSIPTENAVILSGGAITNDANHISGPSRTGYELHLAIQKAMDEAQIECSEVSFLNLHGTATVFNDEMESKAVALTKLSETPVQSLKPYFGHTLGASGIIETIIALHELKEGNFWGTLGFETLGTPQPLVVTNIHQQLDMKHCIKTASGFGGCNAAIVLSLPKYLKKIKSRCFKPVNLCKSVCIENNQIWVNDQLVLDSKAQAYSVFIREAYKTINIVNKKFYKMDSLCKLGYIAASYLLEGIDFEPERMGIVLSNKSSSLDTDIKHAQLLTQGGESGVSPTVFVYTLPNVVLGEICIKYNIKGENTFFITEVYEEEHLDKYISWVMNANNLDYAIQGWCELLGEDYKAEFKLLKK